MISKASRNTLHTMDATHGPFTDKDGELGLLGKEGGLSTDGAVDVVGVGTGGGKVVDVRVDDDVGTSLPERRPVWGTLEAVLNHHGDTGVDLGDALETAVHVVDDPLSTLVGEAAGAAKGGNVVRGFVDGGKSPGSEVSAVDEELQDGVDGLVRLLEAGLVVEPGVMHGGFTNVEVVSTTGERVETDNNVHAVVLDGMVGDELEPVLLVAVVLLGARNLDPSAVSGGNSESVDTDGSELVNGRCVQERLVTCLHDLSAPVTKSWAETPFISNRSGVDTDAGPPDGVMGLLLLQP